MKRRYDEQPNSVPGRLKVMSTVVSGVTIICTLCLDKVKINLIGKNKCEVRMHNGLASLGLS